MKPSHLFPVAVSATLALSSMTPAAVVVTNGDFETDASLFTNWPGYVGGAGVNPVSIPGWIHTGGVGINPVGAGGPADSPFDDPSTTSTGAFAFIQGTASISQVLNGFAIGGTYTISLDVNARGCCGDIPVGEIRIDDVVIASSADAFPAPGGIIPAADIAPWYHFDIPFAATAASHTLTINTFPVAAGDSTLIVDNVSVIPEPSAVVLGALGLALIASRRRR